MILSETALLWVLGILIGALGFLIAIIYKGLVRSVDDLKVSNGLLHNEIEKTKDDASHTHKELWGEINHLRDKFHTIDTTHSTLCVKHENEMKQHREALKRQDTALHARLTVFESKLKGQGDFLNKRIEELKK